MSRQLLPMSVEARGNRMGEIRKEQSEDLTGANDVFISKILGGDS